jgi:hypothetical protein
VRTLVLDEIESTVNELPPPQHEIFIQTELLNFPVKEISQKSGVPVNTLLSRKHYAVLHLRKRLDLFNNPVGYLPSKAWLQVLQNAPHFAVFKRLLFKNQSF